MPVYVTIVVIGLFREVKIYIWYDSYRLALDWLGLNLFYPRVRCNICDRAF